MKKIYVLICWLMAIVFGVLWVNNLVSAYHFHAAIVDGSLNAAKVFPGIWTRLNWTTVDVSTITTFIPFFGFLLLAVNLPRRNHHEDWPFFHNYERMNIALGLLGTIWGIILVGYYPEGEISVKSLMICLHTAMFSTLMAVAWVMVFEPLCVAPVVRLYKDPSQEIDSLSEFVDEFSTALQSSSVNVNGFNQALENLSPELTHWKETLELQRIQQLEAKNILVQLTDCSINLAAIVQAMQIRNQELEKEAAKLAGENQKLAGENEKLSGENAKLTHDNTHLGEQNHDLGKQLTACEAEARKLQTVVQQIQAALK